MTEPELHEPAEATGLPGTQRQPLDDYTIHERLAHITAHLERLSTTPFREPAWLRRTTEEPRVPVIIAVLCAIALQAFVPHSLAFSPWWLMPSLELLLLVSVISLRQTKMDRRSSIIRTLSLGIAVAASFATAWSAVQLADTLIHGPNGPHGQALAAAGPLLRSGGAIWLTNVIVFALWYWDLDRGGPVCRAHGAHKQIDFLFTQMTVPEIAGDDWEPSFIDYFYLSFTNATAFSPTDTLPMTRWSKMTMLLQSGISLVTVALVVARAVNILPGAGG